METSNDRDAVELKIQNFENEIKDENVKIKQESETVDAAEEETRCWVLGRIFKTLSLYMLFIASGTSAPLLGQTITHLGKLYGSSTKVMSLAFPSVSIGFTIGGIICGIIYDRSMKELSFSIFIVFNCLFLCLPAFISNVYGFIATVVLIGLPSGFIITAGQSYCVNLWNNHKLKEPLLQGTHAIWSLGAAIGPFIIKPFLIELSNQDDFSNQTFPVNLTAEERRGDDVDWNKLSNVRFAFVALGMIFFVFGIPFMIIYLTTCLSKSNIPEEAMEKERKKEMEKEKEKEKEKKEKGSKSSNEVEPNKCLDVIFMFMICTFSFSLAYIEGVPMAYLVTFCIKHLHWSVHNASLIFSIFFGSHFLGRIVSIPISAYLKPRTMLITNLLISTSAYILLLFVNWNSFLMWIAASLGALGISSAFPTVILWISETIPITGRVSSFFAIGISAGFLTAPPLVGFLFETYSPMWMVYIVLFASIFIVIFYILLNLFVLRFKERLQKTENYISS